jgi:hypothetical protein
MRQPWVIGSFNIILGILPPGKAIIDQVVTGRTCHLLMWMPLLQHLTVNHTTNLPNDKDNAVTRVHNKFITKQICFGVFIWYCAWWYFFYIYIYILGCV